MTAIYAMLTSLRILAFQLCNPPDIIILRVSLVFRPIVLLVEVVRLRFWGCVQLTSDKWVMTDSSWYEWQNIWLSRHTVARYYWLCCPFLRGIVLNVTVVETSWLTIIEIWNGKTHDLAFNNALSISSFSMSSLNVQSYRLQSFYFVLSALRGQLAV